MWLTIIRLLLTIVAAIIKSRSDKQQQQIGADRVVSKTLLELALRTRVAKEIDLDSNEWSADDVDSILQRYYRNEGAE